MHRVTVKAPTFRCTYVARSPLNTYKPSKRFASSTTGKKLPPVETFYSKLTPQQLDALKPHYQKLGTAIKQRNDDGVLSAMAEIKRLEKAAGVAYVKQPKGNWPPEKGNDFYELMMVKTGLLLDSLGVKPGAEEKAFFEKYTISAGFATLEFVFPTPPPAHTFEEAPLIKAVEGATDH